MNPSSSKGKLLAKARSAQEFQNMEWVDWWARDGLDELSSHSRDESSVSAGGQSIWPVTIRGQEIGRCPAVADLAIDAGPGITIWAFSCEGVAKVWKLKAGDPAETLTRRSIVRDGTIREQDYEGDLEMAEVDYRPSNSLQR